MARNQPGSASTEFFICIGDQPNLDFEGMRNPDGQGFAAFGKVIKGMDVVKLIQQQKDDEQMLVERIDILSITRIQ
jgi:peptidyl-prolyl cis-trans isomerase A (cyclophilin A)